MKFGIREILVMVMFAAIPLAAWQLVFKPYNDRTADLRREISVKQEKLRKLNRLVGSVGPLKKEIASLEKAIQFFQSKLPSKKEIDKVLRETWRLAEQNKLVTKSIRTINHKGSAGNIYDCDLYAEQLILINLQGDFKGFYSFLQALESQPRIMRISRMELKKEPDAEEGYINASFDVSVFFEHSEED